MMLARSQSAAIGPIYIYIYIDIYTRKEDPPKVGQIEKNKKEYIYIYTYVPLEPYTQIFAMTKTKFHFVEGLKIFERKTCCSYTV